MRELQKIASKMIAVRYLALITIFTIYHVNGDLVVLFILKINSLDENKVF
jgi:hypothetical protein